MAGTLIFATSSDPGVGKLSGFEGSFWILIKVPYDLSGHFN
jgi:hypothetical protein